MYTKALSYLDVLSQACTVQGVFPHISTYGEDPNDSKPLNYIKSVDYGVIRLLEGQIESQKSNSVVLMQLLQERTSLLIRTSTH